MLREAVDIDAPLPIGFGQTNSQPSTVAFMLELLQPKGKQKILDVGFGSGWTTALLAYIVGEEGRVFGLEIAPELFQFGAANLVGIFSSYQQGSSPHPHPLRDRRGRKGEVADAGFRINNIDLFNKSGWEGLPEHAPFDRILVSAGASEVPKALKDQLAIKGKMVIPVDTYGGGQTIKLIEKIGKNNFQENNYPGFVFVPLVKK